MSSVQAKSRLRIVIDANVIVSGLISPGGNPDRVLTSWRRGRFQAVSSSDLVQEVAGILSRAGQRYGFSDSDIEWILASLEPTEGATMPLADLPVHSRDPNDDPVLACAFATGADYIVTVDKDLLVLDGDPACGRLRIVAPAAFLELLGVE